MCPPGPTVDLVTAREAVITWLLARRTGRSLRLEGHPEALKDLGWLGLDWEESQGLTDDVWHRLQAELDVPLRVLDRGRPRPVEEGVETVWLAPLEGSVPDLESLGRMGIMSEGVLSFLAESAWTPPHEMRYLTRQELLREFDPAGLKTEPQTFSDEALHERHVNFLHELTPAELWERSLPYWPLDDLPDELGERELLDLEALALLLGEHCQTLADFPRLARFYFVSPGHPDPELGRRLRGADFETVYDELSEDERVRLRASVLGRELPSEPELYQLLGADRVWQRLEAREGGS